MNRKVIACRSGPDPKRHHRARDQRDMNREISPLKQAEDAVLVDLLR